MSPRSHRHAWADEGGIWGIHYPVSMQHDMQSRLQVRIFTSLGLSSGILRPAPNFAKHAPLSLPPMPCLPPGCNIGLVIMASYCASCSMGNSRSDTRSWAVDFGHEAFGASDKPDLGILPPRSTKGEPVLRTLLDC